MSTLTAERIGEVTLERAISFDPSRNSEGDYEASTLAIGEQNSTEEADIGSTQSQASQVGPDEDSSADEQHDPEGDPAEPAMLYRWIEEEPREGPYNGLVNWNSSTGDADGIEERESHVSSQDVALASGDRETYETYVDI